MHIGSKSNIGAHLINWQFGIAKKSKPQNSLLFLINPVVLISHSDFPLKSGSLGI